MTLNLLIKNIHVVDPKNNVDGIFDVLIKKGKIAELKKEIPAVEDVEIFEGKGKYLFPGFIDMHVHFREPGFERKETILTGSQAALKGGFVAAVTMPNTDPPCDSQSVVDIIIRKAGEVPFHIFPAGTLTKERSGKELSEMAELKRAGAKAVSDDGDWVHDSLLMRRSLEYASMLDLLVITHAEDRRLTSDGVMNEGVTSTHSGLKGITHASEEVAVSRDILLAELTGGRLHVTHISTKGAVEMVREAKAKNISVTADVTPHHLALTDQDIGNYDTNFKMMPPLRTEEDRKAIAQGLKDGTIDAIATDHAPHTQEEKMGEFSEAPFGVIGLETAFAVSYSELAGKQLLDLKTLILKFSTQPAEILKLPSGFGEIKQGTEANLAIVDLNQEWTVRAEEFLSKSKNSPFIGRTLKGKVAATICRGKLWKWQ